MMAKNKGKGKCGVPNPMNTKKNKQLRFGHAITHTENYQKSVGITKARCEHDRTAGLMNKRGMKHNSPFKPKIKRKPPRKK